MFDLVFPYFRRRLHPPLQLGGYEEEMSTMEQHLPVYRRLSLAVKYNTVLFPFDSIHFIRALSKRGFVVPESVGPVPFGTRAQVSGVVGRKGNISVRVDTDRYIVGVEAPVIEQVLDEMDAVENLLAEEFDLQSPRLAHYYEFLADMTIRARRNPLESWPMHFSTTSIMGRFAEVLGMDVAPFGVRLVARGVVPDQPDWLELRVEPSIQSPTDHHFVEVVFRGSDRAAVSEFIRKFEASTRNLLSVVEG